MKRISRSTAIRTAAVISFLLSTASVIGSLPLIARGASAINSSTDSPPFVVMMLGLITGVVGIVAAYGAWKQQRWGIILTLLANLLNALGAAPGILFAPTPALFAAAITTVILSVVIIALCLWRDPKPVMA